MASNLPTDSGHKEAPTGAVFTRLDHVGIAVWDADKWIPYYRDVLGFALVGDEQAEDPGTRLVYFDAGNAFIQLVEPVRDGIEIRDWLAEHGEGIHHFCLATDDLTDVVQMRPGDEVSTIFRAGRRRDACFLTGAPEGVRIEVTETRPSW
ncbi:VOC family protein [Compostimonas suwonensis]|uniref:Methylmalonyl-CoA epimerase n=1 Tax=Compostimonas suwonensis TaxID=1048394 RepID=A0A2M9C3F1_9MICO|nr:VOC family protein [Compostimonas suwonensis]PJJ64999.1 methylmalonyl-CoA epimerase [Compostimonas suwonensis]